MSHADTEEVDNHATGGRWHRLNAAYVQWGEYQRAICHTEVISKAMSAMVARVHTLATIDRLRNELGLAPASDLHVRNRY